MSLLPLQAQNFQLSGAGCSIGDTVLNLKSFKDIKGVVILMADIGTIGYLTIEPGNGTQEEQISFTGVTQNSDGTAQLTGISNVAFKSPYTSTSGFLVTHSGSVNAVLSNTAGFYNQFGILANNEAITGQWTSPDPVGMTDIANKEYVLSVVNGGAVSVDTVIVNGTAGETVSAGQFLYLKASDGRWYKTDASDATKSMGVVIGIAQGAGTAGNAIATGVLINGVDTHQTSITAGSTYFLTNTGGAVSTTPGTFYRPVAIGNPTNTKVYFAPVALSNVLSSYALDSSVSANTITVSFSPALVAYSTGQVVRIKVANSITGTTTIAANGLTAKTLVKNYNQNLASGDIVANQIITAIYDGTNFQLLSPIWNLAYSRRQVFTSSGTFTVPAGIYSIKVKSVGAGGGGGGSAGGSGAAGGGGGYADGVYTTTPATAYTVTVGTGGSAGANGDGSAGSATTFGVLQTANGGGGGISGGAGGAGGTATGGDFNITGQLGSRGISGGSLGGHSGGGFKRGGAGASSGAGTAGDDGLVIVEY